MGEAQTLILFLILAVIVYFAFGDVLMDLFEGVQGQSDQWSDQTDPDPSDPDAPEASVEFSWGIRSTSPSSIWWVEQSSELESGNFELFVTGTVTISNAASCGSVSVSVMPINYDTNSQISAALYEQSFSVTPTGSQPTFTASFDRSWADPTYSDLGIPNTNDQVKVGFRASVSTTAGRIGGGTKYLAISNSKAPNYMTLIHTSDPTISMSWGSPTAG